MVFLLISIMGWSSQSQGVANMGNPWFAYPITHGYYPDYHADIWDTPHFADDIAMPVDTPITAFKSGVIAQEDYAVWGGQPGGGEVFVKPDDGSTEYYFYHLDNINVKTGQHVNAGDTVGLSGGQNVGGSHPTATAWSTGPHLHVGYFTNFAPTQIGTRPAGPDITGEITLLKAGGIGPGSSPPPSNGTTPNFASGGMKIGIFLIALIVVGSGAFFVFSKQQVGGLHGSSS
jgi:murein DD-endopeptidase MepM/ murein hydrolase activator NlpD